VKVIGLTGGIGMGKSTAAAAFTRSHIPVFDADAAVHQAQAKGGRAVKPIEAVFPDTIRDGAVDRDALRAAVVGKSDAIERLERILHPLVWREEARFLAAARRSRKRAVVLEIPLFFETGRERRVQKIIVVSAPQSVQIYRVRQRRRMSESDIRAIIARQMPDMEKRKRADIIIRTGLSRHLTNQQMRRLILDLLKCPPEHEQSSSARHRDHRPRSRHRRQGDRDRRAGAH
jgi:dephospho-CoA kinase